MILSPDADDTLKAVRKNDEPLLLREVELAHFTSWLRLLGHKTPAEYPWAAEELPSGQYQWPWGSYQTKNLELLARAADKFWKYYDPTDHSTAPKNEAIKAWLDANNVSNNIANAMATILRADDLPTGPRRKG